VAAGATTEVSLVSLNAHGGSQLITSVTVSHSDHLQHQAEVLLSPLYQLEGDADTWRDWRKTAMLIKHLTRRRLAARYLGSILGFLWSLLNPLLMMGVYTFVFCFVFRATMPGIPYPVFFLTGILAWNFFNVAVMNAATSVVENASILSKNYFPREVLPVSAVLSNAVSYLATIPILFLFNFIFGIVPSFTLLLLPLVFLLLLLVATGVGLIMASLIPFFHDLLHLLDVLFTAWFFATPVLYPMSFLSGDLPTSLLLLYQLNPMVGVVCLARAAFLGEQVPIAAVILSALGGICLLGLGLWVFSRMESHFCDAY
jgi:ABC-type polysaccharide/polyol phosphate export permease